MDKANAREGLLIRETCLYILFGKLGKMFEDILWRISGC
jgi:hypothetical protein